MYLALFLYQNAFVINRESIKKVRPDLPTVVVSSAMSEEEQFQNTTLRPILKYQHDLLVSVFKNHIAKWKQTTIPGTSSQERALYIQQEITRNKQLRSMYEGIVIAMMTDSEYDAYIQLAEELRRRVFTMLTDRLISTLVSAGVFQNAGS